MSRAHVLRHNVPSSARFSFRFLFLLKNFQSPLWTFACAFMTEFPPARQGSGHESDDHLFCLGFPAGIDSVGKRPEACARVEGTTVSKFCRCDCSVQNYARSEAQGQSLRARWAGEATSQERKRLAGGASGIPRRRTVERS